MRIGTRLPAEGLEAMLARFEAAGEKHALKACTSARALGKEIAGVLARSSGRGSEAAAATSRATEGARRRRRPRWEQVSRRPRCASRMISSRKRRSVAEGGARGGGHRSSGSSGADCTSKV